MASLARCRWLWRVAAAASRGTTTTTKATQTHNDIKRISQPFNLCRRSFTAGKAPTQAAEHATAVTVLPGHGIGPELTTIAMQCVDATGAPIAWEVVDNIVDEVTPEALESLRRTGVGIQGFFEVGMGPGSKQSVNIALYQQLDLYANVVHAVEIPGLKFRHPDVDIVIVRENSEGIYSGIEYEVAPGVTVATKVMTRKRTRRIAEYAFEYAYLNNRTKVTAVHKANVMTKADGLFLESCREQAILYPDIEFEEVLVDHCMMRLVSQPQRFDVMVTPNFYGSLVSNAVAGLTGGPGVVPGANMGTHATIFEQGARHIGMDIAGRDVANPTAIILAASMMLRHIQLPQHANRLDSAVHKDGVHRTRDLGGTSSSSQFLKAVLDAL